MAKKRRKNRARKQPPVMRPAQKTAPLPAPLAEGARGPGNRYKTAALALIMLVAVALGAWFALSPTLEKQRNLDRQAELLTSIEQGDGVIVLDEAFAAAEVDFYDDNGAETTGSDMILTPVSAPDPDGAAPAETAAPVDTVVTGIGILTIDRIDARLPVTEGASASQLKVAVGHVPQTPEIGATGNAVIAGHRSYTYGDYFNRLGEMEAGDVISYQPKDGEAMEFEVFEILKVLPGDQAAFWQPEDEQMLTLLTCTPIRTATHRLLVRARLVI